MKIRLHNDYIWWRSISDQNFNQTYLRWGLDGLSICGWRITSLETPAKTSWGFWNFGTQNPTFASKTVLREACVYTDMRIGEVHCLAKKLRCIARPILSNPLFRVNAPTVIWISNDTKLLLAEFDSALGFQCFHSNPTSNIYKLLGGRFVGWCSQTLKQFFYWLKRSILQFIAKS